MFHARLLKFGLPKIAPTSPMTTSLANDSTTALNAVPTTTATARSSTLPRRMNFLKSASRVLIGALLIGGAFEPKRLDRRRCENGYRLRRAQLRPVLGVALGVLAEHVAVDRVELHEAADARRVVGAVHEDAPRGPAEQPAPPELCGRVADREPDRSARH